MNILIKKPEFMIKLLKGVLVSTQPWAQPLLMDLSMATLELNHDALRETLSAYSKTVRDKGYSPPPMKSW
jgi:hypothetical protein